MKKDVSAKYYKMIGKKVVFNDPINGKEYGIVKTFDGKLFMVETFDNLMMIFKRHELKVIHG